MTTILPPSRRVHHYGGPEAIVNRLARRLGYTPGTVGQKLWGHHNLRDQVLAIIAECRRADQEQLLYRWIKPILDCYASTEAPPPPKTWPKSRISSSRRTPRLIVTCRPWTARSSGVRPSGMRWLRNSNAAG